MTTDEIAPAPRRMAQRGYPWVVTGVAFFIAAMAFGALGNFRKSAQGLVDRGCLSLVS